jgi:hypothetical protein
MYGVDLSSPSRTIAKCWANCWMTLRSFELPCPAAFAAFWPRIASDCVMSWNFLLPSLLKPSWTKAGPSLGCVPTWALIAESFRSLPFASGIGLEARSGKYLKR